MSSHNDSSGTLLNDHTTGEGTYYSIVGPLAGL